jgi:molybdopterin converting factor small subunit
MLLDVHLHTTLQIQTPQGLIRNLQVELPQGSTLQALIDHLGVKVDAEETLLVVNGRITEPDRVLVAGDEVHLIPAISGGTMHTESQLIL